MDVLINKAKQLATMHGRPFGKDDGLCAGVQCQLFAKRYRTRVQHLHSKCGQDCHQIAFARVTTAARRNHAAATHIKPVSQFRH